MIRTVAAMGLAIAGSSLLSVGVWIAGPSADSPVGYAIAKPWLVAGSACFALAERLVRS